MLTSDSSLRGVRILAIAVSLLSSSAAVAQSGTTSGPLPAGTASNGIVRLPDSRGLLVFTQVLPRILVGQSFQITVGQLKGHIIMPHADSVTWQSSDASVVSVNQAGLITGVEASLGSAAAEGIDFRVARWQAWPV